MLKQISVFVENKAGRLCAVMETLSKNEINVRAMTIADTADFGIVRLIAGDAEKAVFALHSDNFTVKTTDVIGFKIPDRFGTLYEAVKALGGEGINIEYSYSLMGKNKGEADIVVSVKETEKAAAVLAKAGIELITLDDIL